MLVKVLGVATWACGCVVGHYRDLEQEREVAYIERKGARCDVTKHRQNHAVLSATDESAVSASRPKRVA